MIDNDTIVHSPNDNEKYFSCFWYTNESVVWSYAIIWHTQVHGDSDPAAIQMMEYPMALFDFDKEFYKKIVLPFETYRATKNNGVLTPSVDRQDAIEAAISMYHFREQLPQKLVLTRSHYATCHPDFDLLGDIVNVAKHGTLTRGNPQVTSAECIREEVLVTHYEDEKGTYTHSEKLVRVVLADHTSRELIDILVNVFNMWLDELGPHGVVRTNVQTDRSMVQPISRSDAKGVNLVVIQGQTWRQAFSFRRYIPATGKFGPLEPDIATADSFSFRIFEPPTAEIHAIHPNGEKKTLTIPLTNEQATFADTLSDPAEAESYLLGIAKNGGYLERLAAEFNAIRFGSAQVIGATEVDTNVFRDCDRYARPFNRDHVDTRSSIASFTSNDFCTEVQTATPLVFDPKANE